MEKIHMVVKFDPSDSGTSPHPEDDATAYWQPPVPRDVLDRHGARVLRPAEAVVAEGWPAPRSTVYRAGTLLIPDDILRDSRQLDAINGVLGDKDLRLAPPPPVAELDKRLRPYLDLLDGLPRPVALRVREDAGPTAVDSWVALQRLRAAASGNRPAIDPRVVARISVEHLLFAAVEIGGTPWDSNDGPDGGSYARSRRSGRIPVHLTADPPPRRPMVAGQFDRRPVVAVLDSGIAPHPWFDLPDQSSPPPAGGFLAVLPELQQAIQTNTASPAQFTPTQTLDGYWDLPVSANPLVGDVNRSTGHGTFIAGIIRQAAPDADALSVRVLHSDGTAAEGDVLLALWYLAARVRRAQEHNEPALMIDAVSLSLGYFEESRPGQLTGRLTEIIDSLIGMGVLVVAAAGNDATTRLFYPAALADRPEIVDGGPQLISVGALNPNGSNALFSNDGPWVRWWATGAAVVSTFPIDVQGTQTATNVVPELHRAALDPDDFSAGFAVWDGTSFAAPLVAAKLAAELINSSAGTLSAVDRSTTVKRAWLAQQNLAKQSPA